MNKLKHVTMALTAIFVLGLLTSAQAQSSGRTLSFNTASYEFKGDQVSAGRLPDGSRYATFSGEAKTLNNKVSVSLRSVTIRVEYTVGGDGTGTLTGGTWSLITITKDRPTQSFGGPIAAGGTVNLKTDGTLTQGNLSVTLLVGDPDWPISGFLSGSLDKSKPARLSGSFTLTYPFVP